MKTGVTPIDMIIQDAEALISSLMKSYESFHIANDMVWTERTEMLTRLSVTYDMVKSLSKHIAETDVIISTKFTTGINGSVEIFCTINRSGVDYAYKTDVIHAGGYNIQKAHFRYISHTNLPKSESRKALDVINARIRKMKKEDRIQEEIDRLNGYLSKSIEEKSELKAMSKEQVWEKSGNEKYRKYNPENTNFTSEDHFNKWFNEIVGDTHNRHIRNIRMTDERIDFLNKAIVKQKIKLEKLS